MRFCCGRSRMPRPNSWRCCGPRIRRRTFVRADRRSWDVEQWRDQSRTFADMATFDSQGDAAHQRGRRRADRHRQYLSQPVSASRRRARAGAHLFSRRNRAGAAADPGQPSLLADAIRRLVPACSARRSSSTACRRTIVGVLPPISRIARFDPDVWQAHATSRGARGRQTWWVIGRLRPGGDVRSGPGGDERHGPAPQRSTAGDRDGTRASASCP